MREFVPNSEKIINLKEDEITAFFFSYKENRPTALVVHGLRADTNRMLPFIRILEEKYNVISFDLPGFGKSPKCKEYSNYITYTSEILEELIETLELNRSELTLFGISHGSNAIIELLLKNPNAEFNKIRLMAPIYSYKNLTMKPSYKKFVDWFTAKLEENGKFTWFMQKLFDNKPIFTMCMVMFDIECWRSKEIRDYEYEQWHLQTMQHWGATLKDFLQTDLSKINQTLDIKNMIFAYPRSDQYLDVNASIEGFKRLFPNAEFKFFESQKHIPRGNFVENVEFMESIKKMLDVLA